MSANIIPYISVADNWKKHFTDMVNNNNLKRKKFTKSVKTSTEKEIAMQLLKW